MRQSSLTAMMLLISAQAASAETYHVRHATYACVDPRATLALNDPAWRHAALHSTTRRQGRCFWVRPRENWEQVSHPTHLLRLLRQKPPHSGQPPLYFTNASLAIASLRNARHIGGRHHPGPPTHPAVAYFPGPGATTIAAAPANLPIPAPISSAPPAPAASGTFAPPAAATISAPQIIPPTASSPISRVIPGGGFMRQSAPLLVWALMIATAFLLARMVSRWQRFRALAATSVPLAPPPTEADIRLGECRNRCIAGLRRAGWEASSRFCADVRGADVIASNGGRLLAVQCHPSMEPVDTGDVEDACLARDFQGSDLAAIVSNASFTESARQLAARTGVVLLHENQLASFAV